MVFWPFDLMYVIIYFLACCIRVSGCYREKSGHETAGGHLPIEYGACEAIYVDSDGGGMIQGSDGMLGVVPGEPSKDTLAGL